MRLMHGDLRAPPCACAMQTLQTVASPVSQAKLFAVLSGMEDMPQDVAILKGNCEQLWMQEYSGIGAEVRTSWCMYRACSANTL